MTESGELSDVCACLTALCILKDDFGETQSILQACLRQQAFFHFCYNNELTSPNSRYNKLNPTLAIQSPLTGYSYLKFTVNCSFTMPHWQPFIALSAQK